jgi:hypothetical protein
MLMGLDEQPGVLVGYGPIPAPLAREIAAQGIWRRLLTDPESGALLDHGRSTYIPPAGLADFVRARDLYCRNPICGQRAATADLDHTIPWPEGTTSAHNLYAACRHDHLVKTFAPGRSSNTPTGLSPGPPPPGTRTPATPTTTAPTRRPTPQPRTPQPRAHRPPTPPDTTHPSAANRRSDRTMTDHEAASVTSSVLWAAHALLRSAQQNWRPDLGGGADQRLISVNGLPRARPVRPGPRRRPWGARS